MAEAEQRGCGVVEARHVVTKCGLGLDVLGERVSWVLLAVDVAIAAGSSAAVTVPLDG